ncbi:hypothetical protein [Thiocystis minor]|uniref:hypothetical protein n=1 Tax=Thiocystis minor TaxID=61597 RepID=UPI001F5C83E7|nr:hypothetical protein [Thiocystis minor]
MISEDRRYLSPGLTARAGVRHPDRGGRRGLLPGGHPEHPSGDERTAPPRSADNIGSRLAGTAQERYQVKVIEINEARARELGATLTHALVLHGDGNRLDH